MSESLVIYSRKKQRRNMWIGLSVVTVILSAVFLSYHAFAEDTANTLKIVHVIFRHGDRTPTETYANDPHIHFNWPDGWGALTKKGKHQLYNLGQTLAVRYKTFTGKDFWPKDIHVISSDADRCHMSAATFLAGMFPPSEKLMWTSDLNWQPFAIHSLPRYLDNIVAMKKKCPTYDKALENAYKSDTIKKLNEDNQELFEYLTVNTGQDISNITALEFLFNTLEIEELNGLILPEWTKKVFPNKLKHLAARSLAVFTETPFMQKMKGGVLLKEIVDHLRRKKENKLKPDKKLYFYSAHDISLVNFLRTLGFLESLKPDYGACFVIEGHQIDNDFEIKMFYYNNSATTTPHVMKLSSCGEPCTLENFIQITKDAIPNNWDQECQF